MAIILFYLMISVDKKWVSNSN